MYFDFVIHITEDPLDRKRFPGKFTEFLASHEPAVANMREASFGCCRLLGEVLFDGQGKVHLDAGFEKFACAHSLEVGCLLLCHYEGVGDMQVSVFEDSSYHMH
jgi:hypothetical protein